MDRKAGQRPNICAQERGGPEPGRGAHSLHRVPVTAEKGARRKRNSERNYEPKLLVFLLSNLRFSDLATLEGEIGLKHAWAKLQ